MKKGKHSRSAKNPSPPVEDPHAFKRLRLILMAICASLAFLLYVNTLQHDYAVDDETAIVKNQFTHQGISALPEIFSSAYRAGFDNRKEGLYRPLSIAMFAIEWQMSPSNPHLSHWVNVLLYTFTAILLFITLTYFFGNQNLILGFVTTILFVAHPVHTEVVANIKSRDEILGFLFSLLSLWAIVKYARLNKIIFLPVAGTAVFLGMLSKETALTMVVIAPLTVYFFSESSFRKIITSAIPFIIAAITYLLIRVSILNGLSNFGEIALINNSLAGSDPVIRFATAISIIGRYFWLLTVPAFLSFDYSYNTIPPVALTDPKALLSLAIITALIVFVFRSFRSRHPVSWGILFTGITISPVSNVFFLIEATMAERFLYMPSLGFCIIITFVSARLLKVKMGNVSYKNFGEFIKFNKTILATATILILLYGGKTISRNADWKDDMTLMQADVITHPNSARIHYAYGSELVMIEALNEKNSVKKNKLLDEGIRQLTETVKILPDYGDAWFNLGMAYKEKEDYKKAITCFEHAKENTIREDLQFYIAAGIVYGEDKQYEKSFALLEKAIQLDSTSADAYINLGMFYSAMANYPMSLKMLNKAIELNPESDVAYYNEGNTYAEMNDFITAVEYYKKSVSINPASEISWVNLGNSYGALKDFPNAITTFKRVLEINPSNENARNNLGVTYYLMGDTANAVRYLPKK